MSNRFIDDFRRVYDFLDQVLISCPKCEQCAMIDCETERLICLHCGLAKSGICWDVVAPYSSKLNLSLFLQVNCCGERLWAFNLEHLNFLRDYVVAEQRNHAKDKTSWSNRSMANRLPAWMISASNRTDVVKAIDRLIEMCGG